MMPRMRKAHQANPPPPAVRTSGRAAKLVTPTLTLQSLPAAISAPSSTQARTGMTWLARSGPQY
jgi:hypothetical protein